MAIVDNRTLHKNLPLPFVGNNMDDDAPRIVDAFTSLDAFIHALETALADKASSSHTHAMSAITGLADALAAKAPSAHTHALDDLSDVNAPSPANNQVVMRNGGQWVAATLLLAHISGWESTVDGKIAAAVAGILSSTPAALDTLDELAAALGDDPNFATTMATALGNRLRADTAAQGLNSTQQGNTLTNQGWHGFMQGLRGNADAGALLTAIGFHSFVQGLRTAVDGAAFRTAIGAQQTLGYTPLRQAAGSADKMLRGRSAITTNAVGVATITFHDGGFSATPTVIPKMATPASGMLVDINAVANGNFTIIVRWNIDNTLVNAASINVDWIAVGPP